MAGLPKRQRVAAYAVILRDGAILLSRLSDRITTDELWTLPGGGLDHGEDPRDAVVREVHEETGQRLDAADVQGPIAHRHVTHGYSDQVVEQDDTFYAVRVAAFTVDTAGHTEDEQASLLGNRWWTRAELSAATDTIWPAALGALWDLTVTPELWPLALPDIEESSVPAQL